MESSSGITKGSFGSFANFLESGWRGGEPVPFKFEESWFLELDFLELVDIVWNQASFWGNASRVLFLKLKSLKV